MRSLVAKLTPWRVAVAVIFAAGAWGTWLRFAHGFAASTNLTDAYPWGLWVALNTLCGVGLSAGGFVIAAAVYILGIERYRPVLRASILISFLGYLTVVAGMMYELGLPWRIWHPIIMWNRASVLFEVAWCVMLYTTVLALEFSPALAEKLRSRLGSWYLKVHHRIIIALALAGILLSTMHQSFLGGLFLIMKGRLDPLWWSPNIHVLFYLSAMPAGLAVTLMALYLSARSLRVELDFRILRDVSQVIGLLLSFYALFLFIDLTRQGDLHYLVAWREETLWFWMELGLLVIAPLALLSLERVRRSPLGLYWTSALVVMGFMTHRVNVSINGMERRLGESYFPAWPEYATTLAMVTAAVVVFRFAAVHLKIFEPFGEPRPDKRVVWVGKVPATA